MYPAPDPTLPPAECVTLAEALLTRPFPPELTAAHDFVVGLAQSGPDHHFAPVATSEVLQDASGERWAEVQDEFDERRQALVAALTEAWGRPSPRSFEAESARMVAGEDLPDLLFDLTAFAYGHHADSWQRGDRSVYVVLGMFDKEFPIVLMLVVTPQPL